MYVTSNESASTRPMRVTLQPASIHGSSTPSDLSTRQVGAVSAMPMPSAAQSGLSSTISTLMPELRKATARHMPAMPPPTIRTLFTLRVAATRRRNRLRG
jgi:hypothetical protein